MRLAHLGQLLLELEAAAATTRLVDSIFRELHTLKGSAAVAGLAGVSGEAHELEELVDELRAGHRSVTPELIDLLARRRRPARRGSARRSRGRRPQ